MGNVRKSGAKQPCWKDTNIGKYEVTEGQYTAFLNAVAADYTYELYNTMMSEISEDGTSLCLCVDGTALCAC